MARIEDAHLIRFKMRGKHAEFSLAEPEYSLDEWDHIRTAAFARLRKDGFIPSELLDLVEHFKERTVVQSSVSKIFDDAGRAGFRLGIKPVTEKRKKTKNVLTASEALAFFLRISLRELKHAEIMRQGAPVRTQQLVPRSVIAWVATDLLSSCGLWNHSPGAHLNALIRELLNLDTDTAGATRHVDEQKQASWIIAQDPTVGTRELARRLDVDASTISRWRRNPGFKKEVERWAQQIARWKSSGRWNEMIASAERK